jgi:tetratricopeptide (TPR) repeat protein
MQLAGLYFYTAGVLEKIGDFPGALQNYRQAASVLEPLATDPKSNVFARAYLPINRAGVARMLAETGRIDEAVVRAADALADIKALSDANPGNATLREYVAETAGSSGDILRKKGDFEAALGMYRRDREICKELRFADPNNQQAIVNLGFSEASVGEILVLQGKVFQGLQSFHETIATLRATPGAKNLWVVSGLSQSYAGLGMGYAALAERSISAGEKIRYWREAKSWYQKGLDLWSDYSKPGALDANGHNQAAQITQELARCNANLQGLGAGTSAQK